MADLTVSLGTLSVQATSPQDQYVALVQQDNCQLRTYIAVVRKYLSCTFRIITNSGTENCINNRLHCGWKGLCKVMDLNVSLILSLVHVHMINEVVFTVCKDKEMHMEFVWLVFIVLTYRTEAGTHCNPSFIK